MIYYPHALFHGGTSQNLFNIQSVDAALIGLKMTGKTQPDHLGNYSMRVKFLSDNVIPAYSLSIELIIKAIVRALPIPGYKLGESISILK